VSESICGSSNEIFGSVESSVIFDNVLIKKGAVVRNSIIMEDCVIGEGARISYAILDSGVVVGDGAVIGGEFGPSELTVVDKGSEIKAGEVIGAGVTVLKDGERG
jgi:glucose-1-phosphate adenylyltransferase